MGTIDTREIDLSLMEPLYEAYKGRPGSLIPILQQAQAAYGYLPLEVLKWIADRFHIALGKVHGVATFYSQFHLAPRGEHVLKFCNGTACHVKGAESLASAIEAEHDIRPGETTEDGTLTLESVYCLGSCAIAPVVVLDEEIIGRMHPEALLEELNSRLAALGEDTTEVLDQGEADGAV